MSRDTSSLAWSYQSISMTNLALAEGPMSPGIKTLFRRCLAEYATVVPSINALDFHIKDKIQPGYIIFIRWHFTRWAREAGVLLHNEKFLESKLSHSGRKAKQDQVIRTLMSIELILACVHDLIREERFSSEDLLQAGLNKNQRPPVRLRNVRWRSKIISVYSFVAMNI